MKEVVIEGSEFERVATAFCSSGNKGFDIDRMGIWKTPIVFKKNGSLVLNQTTPGPCGLFAALQANIIANMVETEGQMESTESLVLSIVKIMKLISTDKFSFCTLISYRDKKAILQETESEEEAKKFLHETKYNENSCCCLLLAFSFVYLASSLEWFNSLPAPFIYEDMNTSMQFVFLMVSGQIDGESPKQKNIAVKVSHNNIAELNKYWINENAPIIVVLYGQIHFFAVLKDGEKALVFDTLGNGDVSTVSMNSL